MSAVYVLNPRCLGGRLLLRRARFIAEDAVEAINAAGTFTNKRHAELEVERKLRDGGCSHVTGIRVVRARAEGNQ